MGLRTVCSVRYVRVFMYVRSMDSEMAITHTHSIHCVCILVSHLHQIDHKQMDGLHQDHTVDYFSIPKTWCFSFQKLIKIEKVFMKEKK